MALWCKYGTQKAKSGILRHMSANRIPNYDINIAAIDDLMTPAQIARLCPVDQALQDRVQSYRQTVRDILTRKDSRLLAIVGPCSIHDTEAALDYAGRLKKLSDELSDRFFVIMRTYFEKPRTTVGWKGLILDPDLDGSYNIDKGLIKARNLLIEIGKLGLPVGCEMLDPIIPQYIDELISWASIGARTTESQTHRNLASGLSVPVGFKNSTSGELSNAINAIKSAAAPASFIGMDKDGRSAVYRTRGNNMCHLIMRGGDRAPNYYEDDVETARKKLLDSSLNDAIIIDCSHGNSRKDFRRQKRVLRSVVDQVVWGDDSIRGFMLESNMNEGNQPIGGDLAYGVSITDACIGWEETERILTASANILRRAAEHGGQEEVL